MRAFVGDAYGGHVHEVQSPEPEVGPHDVLVDVGAASINPLDVKVAAGEFKQILRYPLPLVLGHDLAGTVTAVGAPR